MGKPANFSRDDAYALIIGVRTYKHVAIPKVERAIADADALYEALIDPDRGGFPKTNVKKLIDPDTTLINIKKGISDWLHEQTRGKSNATVVIFFAGHGDCEVDKTQQEADGYAKYLLACDTDPNDLFNTALSSSEFARLLKTIKAPRLLIFLDACFSGGIAEARGIRARGERVDVATISQSIIDGLEAGPTRVIISAARSNQRSYEHESLGHGIFTYHLLEALSGSADADRDGYTGIRDIFEYLRRVVPETARTLCKEIQEPVVTPELDDRLDFRLVAHPDQLAKVQKKMRQQQLDQLYKAGELDPENFHEATRILESATVDGREEEIAAHLNSLLDGETSVEAFKQSRKVIIQRYARRTVIEEIRSAEKSQEAVAERSKTVPPVVDEASKEPETKTKWTTRISWQKVIGRAIAGLAVAAIGVGVLYTGLFTEHIDVVVRDLDWEPRDPKVGEVVRLRAQLTATYSKREFVTRYSTDVKYVIDKKVPTTVTEIWSIDGQEKERSDVARIFVTGKLVATQFETTFPKRGDYLVTFSINVGGILDSESGNNAFSRTISVQ